jgi:hypothetical protein
VSSWFRYLAGAVGFGFGAVWMAVGLGSAIVCLLLATLGYGAVLVAERGRAETSTRHQRIRTPDLDEPYSERADDATSPLAAEVEYGWPVWKPEIAHTEGR